MPAPFFPRPPIRSPRLRRQAGLTLVELMVAVAIVAIVLAVAAPSYRQFGRNTRVAIQAADLQGALAYARNESLRRGVRVAVCRSADPQAAVPACSAAASWSSGWLVFVDNVQTAGNVAGSIDGADLLLRTGEPATQSTVTTSGTLGPWVAFSPQGVVRTDSGPVDGAIAFCQAPYGRRITISPVGMLNTATEVCS